MNKNVLIGILIVFIVVATIGSILIITQNAGSGTTATDRIQDDQQIDTEQTEDMNDTEVSNSDSRTSQQIITETEQQDLSETSIDDDIEYIDALFSEIENDGLNSESLDNINL